MNGQLEAEINRVVDERLKLHQELWELELDQETEGPKVDAIKAELDALDAQLSALMPRLAVLQTQLEEMRDQLRAADALLSEVINE